jgi:hypothetical protein
MAHLPRKTYSSTLLHTHQTPCRATLHPPKLHMDMEHLVEAQLMVLLGVSIRGLVRRKVSVGGWANKEG